MAILINGSPGPIYTQTPGTTFTLTNSDNTGVTSWQWTIVDRPTGSLVALTTPTNPSASFTVDVEGTYLIALVVNADLNTLVRAAVVFTNFISSADTDKAPDALRYPAATENDEVGGATRGWTKDLNRWLEFVDKDQVWPRRVAVWTNAAISGAVRVTSFHMLANGVVLPTVIKANSAALSNMPVECFLDSTSPAGGIAYAIINGPTKAITGLNLAGQTVGVPIYLQDNGSIGLTAGTNPQVVGYTIDQGANGRINIQIQPPTAYHGVAPGGTTHPIATGTTAGFLSAADKTKLDSVAALSSTTPRPTAIAGVVGTEGAAAHGDHVHPHGNQTDQGMHAVATPSAHGFMSSSDKTALDSLTGATVAPGGTIYVRTTGNDSTGTGAVGTPFLTIGRALRAIQPIISGASYTIDCSTMGVISLANTLMVPSYISNYDDVTNPIDITIRADLDVVQSLVGTTATVSQPFAYAGIYALDFGAAGFTIDAWLGYFLQHVGGAALPIIHNTATTIYVASSVAVTGGADFQVVRPSTTLQANGGFTDNAVVQMAGLGASIKWFGITFDANNRANVNAFDVEQCRRVIFDSCRAIRGNTRWVGATAPCLIANSYIKALTSRSGSLALTSVFINGDLTLGVSPVGTPVYGTILLNGGYVAGNITTSSASRVNILASEVIGDISTSRGSDFVANGLALGGALKLDHTTASLQTVHNTTVTPANAAYGLTLTGTCTVSVNDVDLTTSTGAIKIGYLPPVVWADFNDIISPQYHNIVDDTGTRASGTRLYWAN
jgi:hypothetical protein